ncbi:unnamed protein product [Adineta steineri]|uniref:Methyltransferase FkbM domain-containing protein n=1 Tax=Adineta steineri TaxID=433720 RepID=A0A813TZE6_9BILA|nr:unnamed protein product [Adineta steineri]CAF3665810.1 unnamed protein product [Adineta steineri]
MEIHLHKLLFRHNYRSILLILWIFILSFLSYSNTILQSETFPGEIEKLIKYEVKNLSQAVNLINLQEEINENYTCIKTKQLLSTIQTTICLHDSRDAVSQEILEKKIWEEKYLIKLLEFLKRYPQMNFIDVGANLGIYTMFAASIGRYVISIECFKPNINRIHKALQIEKLQDNVALISNAIFTISGQYLKLKSDPHNIGSQAIIIHSSMNYSAINDTSIVKTLRFDDILPVLQTKHIRHAVMKVDIQWSELYLCLTGDKVFDSVNIPVILMEWDVGAGFHDNIRYILKYFLKRGYVATVDMCQILDEKDALYSWPPNIFWMKTSLSKIC